jgi:excisionase family DNA binding protein
VQVNAPRFEIGDVDALDAVPIEQVPALIAGLAAAQGQLAARLLARNDAARVADPSDRLLTVEQAAGRIGMSSDWLYRNARRLPFTRRAGRSLRFSEKGVDRWIATRARG